MKEYHTNITIRRPAQEVWDFLTDFENYPDWNPLVGELTGDIREGGTIRTFIVPLKKAYHPVIQSYLPGEELIWIGKQGATFLLAGKHYYRLETIDETTTELHHGECFTGIFSFLIPPGLLKQMKNTFEDHNRILKENLEEDQSEDGI